MPMPPLQARPSSSKRARAKRSAGWFAAHRAQPLATPRLLASPTRRRTGLRAIDRSVQASGTCPGPDCDPRRHHVTFDRRLLLILSLALLAGVAAGAGTIGSADADLNTRITGSANRAQSLRNAIATETRRIRASAPALAAAQRRLQALQVDNARQQAKLDAVENDLARTRARLTRLIGRQRAATAALRANVVAAYRSGRPDIVSVVLRADGFAQLLEQVEFFKRVARHNTQILGEVRRARTAVATQASSLAALQARERRTAHGLARKTDQARVLQTALLRTQQERLAGRARKSGALRDIQQQLAKLRRRLAAAARPGIPLNPGGAAQAPPGAPNAVSLVIAAGNAIAGLPYLYGGGHAGFKDTAYDCSGSISYALAAAGLVSSPMASGGFMTWGESGPGKWITIYTNPGHMFMVVGQWRFDTTALRSGGTRWTRDMRPTAGFLVRHPPGL